MFEATFVYLFNITSSRTMME